MNFPSPTICFVGPALGRHPGYVTTQGEVLAELFRAEGYPVRLTSSRIGRAARATDTVSCLVRWRRSVDVAVISVFSGGAFHLADLYSRVTVGLGLPTVLWLHGGDLPALIDADPARARRVLERGQRIVAPSRYLARACEPLALPVTVIPNVVDLDHVRFALREGIEPRLLWMRTFHELYNPCLALEAFAEVRRRWPDATLTMAGQDAGLLEATKARATALGLDAAVTFPGFVSPPDKAALFARHDVFLNTNRVDNAPVSVIEAAAFGLPVVATAVGGLPDLLVDEESALLVPDGDADAMAQAVTRLVDDPELAARLSRNGREVAERSAWPAVRDAWLDLVSALGGR